ncbi:hypothetical protein SMMN14_01673 [Sphaerulina musiva]
MTTTATTATEAEAEATSVVQVNNFCRKSFWVTVMNGTFGVEGNGTWELPSAWAYETPIHGKGKTPKLILGYTTSANQLWWSIYSLDGEVGDLGFNVTSPARKTTSSSSSSSTSTSSSSSTADICGNAVGYEVMNHNCTDDGEVRLMLNLCV